MKCRDIIIIGLTAAGTISSMWSDHKQNTAITKTQKRSAVIVPVSKVDVVEIPERNVSTEKPPSREKPETDRPAKVDIRLNQSDRYFCNGRDILRAEHKIFRNKKRKDRIYKGLSLLSNAYEIYPSKKIEQEFNLWKKEYGFMWNKRNVKRYGYITL